MSRLRTVIGPARSGARRRSTDGHARAKAEPVARTNWQLFRRRFLRHKLALVSIVILLILIVACFGAPWLAPYTQNAPEPARIGQPARARSTGSAPTTSAATSSREIMYAGQISLLIGLVVALLSTIVGVTVGAVAGYFGRLDRPRLSRVTDLFLILPDLAILAVAIEAFGQTPTSIILVLAALGLDVHRARRARTGAVAEGEGVRRGGACVGRVDDRASSCGTSCRTASGRSWSTRRSRSRPRSSPRRRCRSSASACSRPQNSWGRMLSDAEALRRAQSKFYLIFFPGLMLLLTMLSVNFLGDGLRDAFDPQSGH